jgi:hypothetical protein
VSHVMDSDDRTRRRARVRLRKMRFHRKKKKKKNGKKVDTQEPTNECRKNIKKPKRNKKARCIRRVGTFFLPQSRACCCEASSPHSRHGRDSNSTGNTRMGILGLRRREKERKKKKGTNKQTTQIIHFD